MKDCIASYRKNYPNIQLIQGRTVKNTTVKEIANSTAPHWVAFKTAWAATTTVFREKYKRERARRIVAEEKLTELIDPRR